MHVRLFICFLRGNRKIPFYKLWEKQFELNILLTYRRCQRIHSAKIFSYFILLLLLLWKIKGVVFDKTFNIFLGTIPCHSTCISNLTILLHLRRLSLKTQFRCRTINDPTTLSRYIILFCSVEYSVERRRKHSHRNRRRRTCSDHLIRGYAAAL